jgi:hypothetical protein
MSLCLTPQGKSLRDYEDEVKPVISKKNEKLSAAAEGEASTWSGPKDPKGVVAWVAKRVLAGK